MSTVNQDELKAIKVLSLQEKRVSGITGLKSSLLWQEQEVLQGYCRVQSRHPMQMKILTERRMMAVMN